jgi:hypothetical protein
MLKLSSLKKPVNHATQCLSFQVVEGAGRKHNPTPSATHSNHRSRTC